VAKKKATKKVSKKKGELGSEHALKKSLETSLKMIDKIYFKKVGPNGVCDKLEMILLGRELFEAVHVSLDKAEPNLRMKYDWLFLVDPFADGDFGEALDKEMLAGGDSWWNRIVKVCGREVGFVWLGHLARSVYHSSRPDVNDAFAIQLLRAANGAGLLHGLFAMVKKNKELLEFFVRRACIDFKPQVVRLAQMQGWSSACIGYAAKDGWMEDYISISREGRFFEEVVAEAFTSAGPCGEIVRAAVHLDLIDEVEEAVAGTGLIGAYSDLFSICFSGPSANKLLTCSLEKGRYSNVVHCVDKRGVMDWFVMNVMCDRFSHGILLEARKKGCYDKVLTSLVPSGAEPLTKALKIAISQGWGDEAISVMKSKRYQYLLFDASKGVVLAAVVSSLTDSELLTLLSDKKDNAEFSKKLYECSFHDEALSSRLVDAKKWMKDYADYLGVVGT